MNTNFITFDQYADILNQENKKPKSFLFHPVLVVLALSLGGWISVISTGTAIEVTVVSIWIVIISFKAFLDLGRHLMLCGLYEATISIKNTLQIPVLEIDEDYTTYCFVAPSKEIVQKYHELKAFEKKYESKNIKD